MNVHENVILDLLPAVRGGHASAESRTLVEEYLKANPQLAAYAALMPTPDPQLELRTLERTRQEVGRNGWLKGLAIFFTLLPLSFIVDDAHGFRFLFAKTPVLMAAMVLAAAVFWGITLHYNRRWSAPK
jgi:hypothetical protein